jgi:hypothetical protein
MYLKHALVHEWLTPKATGGSELVVQEILKHIDADLYALIDFESTNPQSYLFGRKIGTTFLQHLPFARNGVQKYLPLLPLAIEQLDLRGYDVILSSSHAVAKGILTTPQQLHICYCHTPMRYAWDLTFDYLRSSRMGRGSSRLNHAVSAPSVASVGRPFGKPGGLLYCKLSAHRTPHLALLPASGGSDLPARQY